MFNVKLGGSQNANKLRESIREEVGLIQPLDRLEQETKLEALSWIDSGVELCRLKKPATPPKHLVAYCVVVDGDYVLLVDHINAELWLPTGGHVNPGEHPRDAALREALEELALKSRFLKEGPVLLTTTETVGKTAGHTDVSLWYAIRGDRCSAVYFDESEFCNAMWFHKNDLPNDRIERHMSRFMHKFFAQ